jgi:hypothetical protein
LRQFFLVSFYVHRIGIAVQSRDGPMGGSLRVKVKSPLSLSGEMPSKSSKSQIREADSLIIQPRTTEENQPKQLNPEAQLNKSTPASVGRRSNAAMLEHLRKHKFSASTLFNKISTVSENFVLESVKLPRQPGIAKVEAIQNYLGGSEMELSFRKNHQWILLEKTQPSGWWLGCLDDREGFFPSSYVRIIEEYSRTPVVESQSEPIIPLVKDKDKEKEKKRELLENFQIGERIGKGAYGSVYRGINVENGEMVAIKQVSRGKVNNTEIASILSELDLLKELNHPNILSYKGFIKTNEHINIVLDFVEGGSLHSILEKFGPIPERLAVCYVKQILHGLNYLHSRGVIHRDIKCGNILVTKDGSVKLADFGIAMRFGDGSAQAVGSPYWMAPEVIELQGSSSAADIWALGCTIIELLTGSPPYYELNQVQAMFSMVENEMPPIPKQISTPMESFLKRCFKRAPEDRDTAQQLLRHALIRAPDDPASEDEHESENDLADLEQVYDFASDFDVSDLDGILDTLDSLEGSLGLVLIFLDNLAFFWHFF